MQKQYRNREYNIYTVTHKRTDKYNLQRKIELANVTVQFSGKLKCIVIKLEFGKKKKVLLKRSKQVSLRQNKTNVIMSQHTSPAEV